MNKRGQIVGIITFVTIIIIMIFMAPMLMKIVLTPTEKFMTALGTIDGTNKSVEGVSTIKNTFTRMFDWVVLALFVINMIVLLASSFLVNVHPMFLIMYIIAVGMLVIFGSNVTNILSQYYANPIFATEVSYLPLTKFLLDYFWIIIMGIVFISGIILYGKLKSGKGSSY